MSELTGEAVRAYCEHLFTGAGYDSFDYWWFGEDPGLEDMWPSVLSLVEPRRVIARAEGLCHA